MRTQLQEVLREVLCRQRLTCRASWHTCTILSSAYNFTYWYTLSGVTGSEAPPTTNSHESPPPSSALRDTWSRADRQTVTGSFAMAPSPLPLPSHD